MSKKNLMNLFIYIFLLHLVDNKAKFYFKNIDKEDKYEFTLNLTNEYANQFYNILKANKTISVPMEVNKDDKNFYGTVMNIGRDHESSIYGFNFQRGEIVVGKNSLYIFLLSATVAYDYDRIGQIINTTNFETYFDSEKATLVFYLEGEEEKEKDEKQEKTKKPGGWKTLKINERIKALKRYRILKRLKNLKILKN